MKKVIFVTGASRGMGLAILKHFKAKKWITVGCSSHGSKDLDRVATLSLKCDVTDSEAVKSALTTIQKRFGRLDVLVNNAGISGSNSLDIKAPPAQSDDLWHHIIDVNLHGTYYITKAALPLLKKSGSRSRIINISSVLGLKGVPDTTAYCAAKHAVIGFTRSLAHSVARDGITVNAICPGWTRTTMGNERMAEIGMTEKDLKKALPMGRMTEPEEIAELVDYLVNPKSQSMTGQTLTIDGGFLA